MVARTNSLIEGFEHIEKILPKLELGQDVFLAQCGDTLIFLNLDQDDYISIEPKFTRHLLESLGLPPSDMSTKGVDDVDAAAVTALLRDLAEAGLVRIGEAMQPFKMLTHPADIEEMRRFGVGGPNVKLGHLVAMVRAVLIARWKLGVWSLFRAVDSVKRRRPAQPVAPEREQLRALVEIYRKLRPLFMSRRDKCLLDALTLVEFLAGFSIYPNWIFGVRHNAFAAHCWVQLDSMVLDDDLENVCDYAVIMRC